jgi:hypothetical protein
MYVMAANNYLCMHCTYKVRSINSLRTPSHIHVMYLGIAYDWRLGDWRLRPFASYILEYSSTSSCESINPTKMSRHLQVQSHVLTWHESCFSEIGWAASQHFGHESCFSESGWAASQHVRLLHCVFFYWVWRPTTCTVLVRTSAVVSYSSYLELQLLLQVVASLLVVATSNYCSRLARMFQPTDWLVVLLTQPQPQPPADWLTLHPPAWLPATPHTFLFGQLPILPATIPPLTIANHTDQQWHTQWALKENQVDTQLWPQEVGGSWNEVWPIIVKVSWGKGGATLITIQNNTLKYIQTHRYSTYWHRISTHHFNVIYFDIYIG